MNTRLAKYWPDQSTVKFRALGYKLQDQVGFFNCLRVICVDQGLVHIRICISCKFQLVGEMLQVLADLSHLFKINVLFKWIKNLSQ